jgi:N-methylhydantoinase A
VPRRWRLPIRERIDARGRVVQPLEEADIDDAAAVLREAGIASVAVGFLHSFTNPAHERRVGARLGQSLPGVPVTLSSEVSPEMREYERFTTACANAYVQPVMSRYLRQLEEDLRAAGVGCPLLLMTSGGGLTTVDTAIRFPVRLIESGPAGGAIFAAGIARRCGIEKLISFDMGGTTAKICLIDHAQPQTNRVFEAARLYRFKKGSGHPLRIPVIEMVEIGAGGGSIARRDATGRIAIGPDSAGAEPGPACYGRGGDAPTVTDADLLLGRISPAGFSGGAMSLDARAAASALASGIGEPLGLSPEFAALGVSEMVDENMANAARVHTTESGKSVADRTLVAFGGAAPLHVARVAEKLGVRRVLVPAHAGVGSALGFLQAPIAHEIIRSGLQRLSTFDAMTVNQLVAEIRTEAIAFVRQGAAPGAVLNEHRSAFMRYRGQGHEIPVPLPVRAYTPADCEVFRAAFESAYRTLYRRTIPGVDIEILSWVVAVRAGGETVTATPRAETGGAAGPFAQRPVFDAACGRFSTTPVYLRRELPPGSVIHGPAVIEEDETSTVVSPLFDAQINPFGDIELTRRDRPAEHAASAQ